MGDPQPIEKRRAVPQGGVLRILHCPWCGVILRDTLHMESHGPSIFHLEQFFAYRCEECGAMWKKPMGGEFELVTLGPRIRLLRAEED